MATDRRPRRLHRCAVLAAVIGTLAACGGSDSTAPADNTAAETETDVAVVTDGDAAADPETATATATETETGTAAENETDAAAEIEIEGALSEASSGDGSATLSLANGESYEFSVLCNLEPQIAAGSEILFTATSYDDPGFDATQFGDTGAAAGIAAITVFDGSYESLWEAGSMFEAVGGSIELSLDGSTITGTATFFPAGDMSGDPVAGTLTANC